MKYNLIGTNDYHNVIKTTLQNRNIEDYITYLNLCSNSKDNYTHLDNIEVAVNTFVSTVDSHLPIAILSDTDVDGVCSATIMYQYIKLLDKDYPVEILVHNNNKAHGLSSGDFIMPEYIKLLIIPDAGSNDIKEINLLKSIGIDVIVLDHHVKNNTKHCNGIIVNNQESSRYENKCACGAHVTYNFLQALDDYYWNDYCDIYFADLVALADIADVMDLRSFNTRAIVNYGLKNITNKMLKQIISAQEFSMKGKINPFTIAFYVSPMINAFLRMASVEERTLLLRAFCEDESETFEYTKRGESFPIIESIYQHVSRLMQSYKGKQNRLRDKYVKEILASKDNYKNDKVVIIDVSDIVNPALTGVVAIRISEALNKPVLLLRSTQDNCFSGSGRAFDDCPIDDFRHVVESCPTVNFAQGHNSAFGVSLNDINESTEWFNNSLRYVNFSKTYKVDFELYASELTEDMFLEVSNNSDVFAHGVDEPLWCIHNVIINDDTLRVCGKQNDTVQIKDESTNITYVAFKLKDSDALLNFEKNHWGECAFVDIIGRLSVNYYNGTCQFQVIITDYNINYLESEVQYSVI